MQRRSDVHNPRVDEEMAKEVRSLEQGTPIEARSRADLLQEDFETEGGDTHASGERPGAPTGLTPDEVDMRSQLAQALRPGELPANRQRLLEVAREAMAPARVLAVLDDLPDDRHYDTIEQIWEALGHGTEHRA
ncbi:MAG TPA: DUF2795 domain-containing protein [Acidimicrobiales bacterium]|nr:DUF2795 domain-containing protein [Acidimicrobiales bacterium]